MALNEYDIIDIKNALIKTLEAQIDEILLKLKGETKSPEPKKVALSARAEATLYPEGGLTLKTVPLDFNPNSAKAIPLDPDEVKRLTSFLKDGE